MCSINHDKKCIFIHVPKTGGTYIRENLEKYYGFKTYHTKRDDHNEVCDIDNLYYENIKKNYHTPNRINGILYFFKDNAHNKKKGIYEYLENSEYINKKTDMTNKKWDEYYKFCFFRNPYDRLYSGFNYCMNKLNINIDFENYIFLDSKNVSDFEYFHIFMPQYKHMINNNKELKIDYIADFNNINDEFIKILKHIGFTDEEIIHENIPKNKSNYNNPLSIYINNEIIKKKIDTIVNIDIELKKKIDTIVNIDIEKKF